MTTELYSSSELPVNTVLQVEQDQLIARLEPAVALVLMADVVGDPDFTVHYQDEQTLIAEAFEGSVGAFALADDGNWEARMNVTDPQAKTQLLNLARAMTMVRAAKEAQDASL